MSPFASYLRELRQRRGLKQKEVAELLGYEQSYLSSLEKGLKGLPRRAFVDRLISRLALDSEEVAELDRVLKCSDRRVLLPANASPDEYALWHELRDLSGRLDTRQIQSILGLLQAFAPTHCCSNDSDRERRATM